MAFTPSDPLLALTDRAVRLVPFDPKFVFKLGYHGMIYRAGIPARPVVTAAYCAHDSRLKASGMSEV